METSAKIALDEIEDKKRWSLIGRALNMCMRNLDINCEFDVREEEGALRIIAAKTNKVKRTMMAFKVG